MKRSLITKVIAGGFFAIAAFVSYAATVTTTSDYFTVDTRNKLVVRPISADWSKGAITLGWDTTESVDGSASITYNVYWSDSTNNYELSNIVKENIQRTTLTTSCTDTQFLDRLDGIKPVCYFVVGNDGSQGVCITRKRFGLSIGYTGLGYASSLPEANLFWNLYGQSGAVIDVDDSIVIYDSNASNNGIDAKFTMFKEKVNPGDIFALFVATHGMEAAGWWDGKPYYPGFQTSRDTWYKNEDLKKSLNAIGSKGCAVIGILTTCGSGYIAKQCGTDNNKAWITSTTGAYSAIMSGDSKVGQDYYVGTQFSLFARCFLEYGWEMGCASKSSVLTFKNLAQHARENVMGWHNQGSSHRPNYLNENLLDKIRVRVNNVPKIKATLRAPENLIASRNMSDKIVISWSSVAGAKYYYLFVRKAGTTGNYDFIYSMSGETLTIPFHDHLLSKDVFVPERGVEYEFRIAAYNEAGAGTRSTSVYGKCGLKISDLLLPVLLPFSQTYTFTSYLQLPDDGGAAGTMTVKTQKEKGGVAAATVTIQTAGGKKQTIKGTISTADGTGQGALAGLTFTASGVTGTFNGHVVDGAVDASKSKDAATVALLNKFKGKSYVMALEPESTTGANADKVNGVAGFSIVFSAKGKAKVSGTMPDGTKASVSSQLIVGSEWCCLPVVYSKTGNSLAFLLWFDREGNFDSVSGMTAWKGKGFEVKWNEDVAVSKVGNLSGASYFNLAERPTKIGGMSIVKWILPINVKVTPNGTKWDVPESSSVKMDRSGALVYGANPSALKLTYKAKTGTFSGRVTFYSDIGGRLKKIRAMVNGIVVDGIGYGMATVKKQGTWPVVIGPNKIEVTFETAGVVLPSNFVGEYTGCIADFSRATGNPKWPMERGTLAMSIGADGETQVVIDSILGKVLFSAKGWDYYSKDYGYADVVLIGNGGEQLTLSVRSDLEWYHTELEGSVVGGIFGSTQMTIYGARNRFTDSWGAEVKDGVKAFLAKQTGNHRISVSSINYGGGYPYNWVFGIANEGENAPLTLTIDDDGTATVTGTLNGRKIEGVTRILFWSAEYYARANFYLQLDATTECLLSFALYSCYEPWQNIGGEGWMRNIR